MSKNSGPYLPNLKDLIAAGIDPKTGLPKKLIGYALNKENLKEDMERLLRIIDRQDAINRFVWYNLPDGIDGELLERMLYYRGQLCLFYMKETDQFYILPYTLNGNINMYGRFNEITPIPFNGNSQANEKGEPKAWIQGLSRTPVYDIKLEEEVDDKTINSSCVLLHDYSKGISETLIPRSVLNSPLVSVEAEMVPMMRTSMLARTGVQGMRVNNENEYQNVEYASDSLEDAAIRGRKYVPIVGSEVGFQSLDSNTGATVQEFAQAMQTVDNLRLSTLGLTNGGIFQKQGTILQSESDNAEVNTELVLQEGLNIRQNFCNVANSIWGLGIWCEIRQPEHTFEPSMEQETQKDNDEEKEDNGGVNNE